MKVRPRTKRRRGKNSHSMLRLTKGRGKGILAVADLIAVSLESYFLPVGAHCCISRNIIKFKWAVAHQIREIGRCDVQCLKRGRMISSHRREVLILYVFKSDMITRDSWCSSCSCLSTGCFASSFKATASDARVSSDEWCEWKPFHAILTWPATLSVAGTLRSIWNEWREKESVESDSCFRCPRTQVERIHFETFRC